MKEIADQVLRDRKAPSLKVAPVWVSSQTKACEKAVWFNEKQFLTPSEWQELKLKIDRELE